MKLDIINESLRIGYAKVDITPGSRAPLAGRPSVGARRAKRIRDRLYARALHVSAGRIEFTMVAADLLLVTGGIHKAVSEASGHDPATLLLCGTHTHSGPGGFWRGTKISRFMGPYDRKTFDFLVSKLAGAAGDAARSMSSASLSAASIRLDHASENRRVRSGRVDNRLTLLRFDVPGDVPACMVFFGAHPVGGMMLEPNAMTADYPGELCARLERAGFRPLFIQGAAGAASPAGLNRSLDGHIGGMADALMDGIEMAERRLERMEISDPLCL